jgi:hypothetical protein
MAGWISQVTTAEHMGDVQSTAQGDDDDIGLSTDRSFSCTMGKFLSPDRRSSLQLRENERERETPVHCARAVTCVGSLHIFTDTTGYDVIPV